MLTWALGFGCFEIAVGIFVSPIVALVFLGIFFTFLLIFIGFGGVTATLSSLHPLNNDYNKYTHLLKGKTCLITGANSGIGFGVAKEMVEYGCNVIIAGRSNLQETVNKLKNCDLKNECTIKSIYVDLSDYQSILLFLKQLSQYTQNENKNKIDICVLNAGVTIHPSVQVPHDKNINMKFKIDLMTMVNCMSNFILVKYFSREKGRKLFFSKNNSNLSVPRIVYCSSETHHWITNYKENGLFERISHYSLIEQVTHYAKTKFWNQMFAMYYFQQFDLCEKRDLKTGINNVIDIYTVCPGPVATSIGRNVKPLILNYLAKFVLNVWFQSPTRGANHLVYLSMIPRNIIKPGAYYWMMYKSETSKQSINQDNINHALDAANKVLNQFEQLYGVFDLDKKDIVKK